MRLARRFHLLFWTVRYLSLTQIAVRLKRITRGVWRRRIRATAPDPSDWRPGAPQPLYAGLRDVGLPGPWHTELSEALGAAREIAHGRFCFLNRPVGFSSQIGWHDPELSQLWRYHLHYFGYVQELLSWSAAERDPEAYNVFRYMAQSWIASNRLLKGDGWHPYTISLRAVNWLHAVSAFEVELASDQEFKRQLLSNLYGQGRVLANDLELDVRGNHLLENLRALLWLGLSFEGREPRSWFERAMHLLQVELDEQVLSDGGHFERAPGYHLIVLKNCLEIALWLRRNSHVPAWLDDALRRMLSYLLTILAPDGQVPLLKDTSLDAGPNPYDLFVVAALYFSDPAYKRSEHFGLYPLLLFGHEGWGHFREWPLNSTPVDSALLKESRYCVMRDDAAEDYLIFDVGKPSPDYLPAHAHADLLSFELLVQGRRIVVDSGVYEYTSGPWRDFFRSTRAHNTVEVAGENQSEVWGSFRMAKRARPGSARWLAEGGCIVAQGSHDGYARLRVPALHRRTVLWRRCSFWLVVDELQGHGEVNLASYIHLAPGLDMPVSGTDSWVVAGLVERLHIRSVGFAGASLVSGHIDTPRQGWYSPKFGVLMRNCVLTLRQSGRLPIVTAYVISKGRPADVFLSNEPSCTNVLVAHQGERYSIRIEQTGAFSLHQQGLSHQ